MTVTNFQNINNRKKALYEYRYYEEKLGIDKSGISRHLAKIFETGELNEKVVVAKIATTTQHGAMQ